MGRNLGIIGVLIILMVTACSPERNLARQYKKTYSGSGILIMPLYELFKDNLTISFDSTLKYSPMQQDSLAWEQSCFVKHVSDSVFLSRFTNSLIERLSLFGYDVYLEGSSDVFLALPDPKWIIQIAQLQLNEEHSIYPYNVYSVETGEPVSDDIRINTVKLESWFEASLANEGRKQVLYLEGYIQDNVRQGIDFSILEGATNVHLTRDSVGMADVYKMAEELGKKNADLLFDYFMNEYIRMHLPAGMLPKKYYFIDRDKSNRLRTNPNAKYDIMEPQPK